MRLLIALSLCILNCACTSNGNSTQRTYVITQAQETAAETEAVTEPEQE